MGATPDYDLVVIGGGSGGFGATLAAARRGLRVLLVERGPMLGGNSTLGGVNTWEPGIGGPGFHAELYELLKRQPNAIGVSRTIHTWTQDEPWGRSRVDPALPYRQSLRRSGIDRDDLARVTFEPQAMATAMQSMLEQTGHVTVCIGTSFAGATCSGDRLESVEIETDGQSRQVTAAFMIDATANLNVATAVGCATYLGCEPQAMYEEPSAPPAHENRLNGVSLCFRVTPTDDRTIEPLPPGVPDEPRQCSFSITEYPNGDLNLNPLPIMEGIEFHQLGPAEGRRICEQRVHQAWRWLQQEKGFDKYRMVSLSPFTGVREGPRLIARRVLTENDVRAGCSGKKDADRWITLADHALDVHGQGHLCREVNEPYGVPYDCLLPREYSNLAVACRGAGFSHLGASSCRLSRTMMQLGHAAGLACALAVRTESQLPDVAVDQIQQLLSEDNVTLNPNDDRFPKPV